MSQNGKRYWTLWGGTVSGDKVVGYCRLHKVHLTARQAETKRCSAKGCRSLKKWDCPYWDHKHRMKELRQIKKDEGIPPWQKVEIRTDRHGKLLPKLRKKR